MMAAPLVYPLLFFFPKTGCVFFLLILHGFLSPPPPRDQEKSEEKVDHCVGVSLYKAPKTTPSLEYTPEEFQASKCLDVGTCPTFNPTVSEFPLLTFAKFNP